MVGLLLVASLASATDGAEPAPARFRMETTIAAELSMDGLRVAQLLVPGRVEFLSTEGPHQIAVAVAGRIQVMDLELDANHLTLLRVTPDEKTIETAHTPAGQGSVPVELRCGGISAVEVRLGEQQFQLNPGRTHQLQLANGEHKLLVRSADGLATWARGALLVDGSEAVVVRLQEGRLPEVSGDALFLAGG